jgi:predicted nucleic acid-binding protein
MQTEPTRLYWDACVLLSYVNETAGRLPVIEQVLEEARQNKVGILTSTLTVVEVAWASEEQQQGALDDATLEKIDGLWQPGSIVTLVEFYFAIACEARNLMRDGLTHGWSLRPADAIHLATAKEHHVKRFHTYDERLFKYAELTGFEICEPDALQPQLPGVS